jgi:hypothetical protein
MSRNERKETAETQTDPFSNSIHPHRRGGDESMGSRVVIFGFSTKFNHLSIPMSKKFSHSGE